MTRERARLDGAIEIAPPQPAATLLASRHANGERFFQIADSAPGDRREAPPVGSVAILWDRSLSRADDDLDSGDRPASQSYLERVRPAAIDLILFDSGGARADARRRAPPSSSRGFAPSAIAARPASPCLPASA